MTPPFLPYGRHLIEDDDIEAVVNVLRSGWLTTGPTVKAFEDAFAAKVGARHAVACNSGTAALHLAALALDPTPGDVVVAPTLTFLASANGARYAGCDIEFADADPETGLMTPETVSAALSRGGTLAKAVVVVHLNGQTCDMEAIHTVTQAHGVSLIEDACHAIGASYTDSSGARAPVGACRHSDIACFSFHPVKTIAMGEGGMVTTNDSVAYERMRRLRNHFMVWDPALLRNDDLAFDTEGTVNPWYYEMPALGYNYRASDINCALGLSQLAKLDRFVARRRELADLYDERLNGLRKQVTPVRRVPNCDPAWHLYAVHIGFPAPGQKPRAQVMRELRDIGIGTQVHYIPVHRQPYYTDLYGEISLPGADAYYEEALSLPLFPGMADGDVDRVVDGLRQVLAL